MTVLLWLFDSATGDFYNQTCLGPILILKEILQLTLYSIMESCYWLVALETKWCYHVMSALFSWLDWRAPACGSTGKQSLWMRLSPEAPWQICSAPLQSEGYCLRRCPVLAEDHRVVVARWLCSWQASRRPK